MANRERELAELEARLLARQQARQAAEDPEQRRAERLAWWCEVVGYARPTQRQALRFDPSGRCYADRGQQHNFPGRLWGRVEAGAEQVNRLRAAVGAPLAFLGPADLGALVRYLDVGGAGFVLNRRGVWETIESNTWHEGGERGEPPGYVPTLDLRWALQLWEQQGGERLQTSDEVAAWVREWWAVLRSLLPERCEDDHKTS